MKRFIRQIILFSILALIVIEIRPMYLIVTERYKEIVAGKEIYYSINKSLKKSKSRKLIIGDSVGNQLFNNKTTSDTINSLACNQSISMAGQYILLHNYLSVGNQIDTVILICTPFTFTNNLDQVFTYHYFIKPFYSKYHALFSDTVVKQVHKIPYCDFYWIPNILTSNWAPNFNPNDKIDYTFLSPVSIEYLHKMKTLAREYHFKLIILPTPTRESRRYEVQSLNKQEIINNGLVNEFEVFFKDIIFLNDSNFEDHVHLKVPKVYTNYYKKFYL
jgi:hypothetical protein